MPAEHQSRRGEHRLEIARGLLALNASADVMAEIKRLRSRDRDQLRAHVDWVEEYDAALAETAPGVNTEEADAR